jgi:hypothetical protein
VPIPFDFDIPIFLWAMARVIFRRHERAQKLARTIPVIPIYEEIPDNTLTKAQREYIRPFDQQLASMNYQPICTYRATNFGNWGSNLIRRYSNPADAAWCALTVLELKVKVDKLEAVKTTAMVSFSTRFADGKLLTTRNMSQKSLGENPPDRIVQECRQTTDLRELKKRHDARSSQMGAPLAPAAGAKDIFEEQSRDHQRLSKFQVERGIYRPLPDGQSYEVTDKAQVRGLWNHFNPFARRVSWMELIANALIGSGLPLVSIHMMARALAGQAKVLEAPVSVGVALLIIAAAYCLAGSIIGLVTDWAPFYWIMLISYVPAHAIAGWSFGPLPFSTMMFVTAFSMRQMLRRRKLIFAS